MKDNGQGHTVLQGNRPNIGDMGGRGLCGRGGLHKTECPHLNAKSILWKEENSTNMPSKTAKGRKIKIFIIAKDKLKF